MFNDRAQRNVVEEKGKKKDAHERRVKYENKPLVCTL